MRKFHQMSIWGLESDYYLLMSTYFVQMDLEPPSVYEEKHQYRLKETESYILMYEWMIKAIEELNEDYIELAFTYLMRLIILN